jgi:Tfp pilus assembly protein PilF
LDRAIQLGEERAHYTLAFTYVKKGDPQRALPEFEAYLKADPESAIAKRFVADIQSGKVPAHVVRHEATESR